MDGNRDENEEAPSKRKRGGYRLYLEPQHPSLLPRRSASRYVQPVAQSDAGCSTSGNAVQLAAEELANFQPDHRDTTAMGFGNIPVPERDDAVDDIQGAERNVAVPDSRCDTAHQAHSDKAAQQQRTTGNNIIPPTLEAPPNIVQVDAGDQEDLRPVCIGVCVCDKCVLPDADPPEVQPLLDGTSKKQYRERYDWNAPLLPYVSTTMFEAFLMIMHMVMRYHEGGPFIKDMFKFVNALLQEEVVPVSEYLFNRMFAPVSALTYHFFCVSCHLYLGTKESFEDEPTKVCPNCGSLNNVKSTQDENYFITLSVRHQIEEILRRSDLKIIPHLERQDDVISDIMDGQLYKLLCQAGYPLADENSLSVTFNTDGASCFNTGGGSIWPIQLYINEVAPEERFNSENMILAGMWFGRQSPNMSTFIKPFVAQFEEIEKNGVLKAQPDGSLVRCTVIAPLCTVDSIAKPKLQSIKQFNGRNACGYCYHPNKPCPELGNMRRYTADQEYAYRSHEEMERDMMKADSLAREGKLKKGKEGTPEETYDDVNGLKGLSPLLLLPYFHIVFGFGIDYLHCLLEGVMATLFTLFLSTSYNGKRLVSEEQQLIIDSYLESITPPNVMSWHPRKTQKKADWKAKEWRNFMLFFALPCLTGILPDLHFRNLQDFVTASYILLQNKISKVELKQADMLMGRFVKGFNRLYGNAHITYNVHLCTHLAKIVEMWGPLWCYSTFCFESGNGHLLKLISGTRGVPSQICRKFIQVRFVSTLFDKYEVKEKTFKFCSDIFNYEYIKKSDRVGNVTLLGAEQTSILNNEESIALEEQGLDWTSPSICYYNRAISNKVIYYSGAYRKPKKFDDTCVALLDNSYAKIEKIVKLPPAHEIRVFLTPLRISEGEHLCPHIKTCALDVFAPIKIIPFSQIARKCLHIVVGPHHYISDFPNEYEKD